MDTTQLVLIICIGVILITMIIVWSKDRKCGTVEGYNVSANDLTANRPYPMYVNHNDLEGGYKYLQEYEIDMQRNPFIKFPSADNYTKQYFGVRRLLGDTAV